MKTEDEVTQKKGGQGNYEAGLPIQIDSSDQGQPV